ncbi:MAG: ATP-binding protein, partial [Campylobacterota bacterium]|nr:ATP-binding protein [Campylobacterota bacterium]
KYFILFFMVIIFILHSIVHYNKNKSTDEYLQEKTQQRYMEYQVVYNNYKAFANMTFQTHVNTSTIIDLFAARDRVGLKNYLDNDYQKLRQFSIRQLHFHLPNNDSFLRMHRPNKFGDNLTKARLTVKYVNENKKFIHGFEEGKIFNGFRFVYPLFKNNEHIGSVEVSYSALFFIKEMVQSYNVISNFFIDKKIVGEKVFSDEKSNYMQSPYEKYLIQKSIMRYLDIDSSKIKLSKQYKESVYEKVTKGAPFSMLFNGDMGQIITYIPLKNPITKKTVAVLSIKSDDRYIQNKQKNTLVFFLLMSSLVAIILYVIYKQLSYQYRLQSEVKEKTKALRMEKHELEKAQRIANLGFWSLNLKNNKVHWSKEIFNILEVDSLTFKPNNEVFLNCIHPEDKANLIDAYAQSLKDDEEYYINYRLIMNDGRIKWIKEERETTFDANGQAVVSTGVMQDITQERCNAQVIAEQAKMASMGEMIGNIAHQWRQPLSVISTAATGIKVQKEFTNLSDEDLFSTCDAINNNAQYLSRTIDDFRNFIKGERVKSFFNLKAEIDSFLNLIDGTIKENGIDIVLDIQEDIQIHGYQNELTQCFINIFNNAKDILIENELEPKLIFIATQVDKNNVHISIKDNAGGIAKKNISKVFEPYFTTKHQSQGTGLGLHMTYNLIVDGMHGSISVQNTQFKHENKDYVGAEFSIILPIQ